jgi:asparagine synthase (glutamine-hydrolysing)
MGAWLKRELASVLKETLSPEAIEHRGWLRSAPVARLIADHEANRVDGTDRLLALVNLEIWARIYLDGREPAEVTDDLRAAVA